PACVERVGIEVRVDVVRRQAERRAGGGGGGGARSRPVEPGRDRPIEVARRAACQRYEQRRAEQRQRDRKHRTRSHSRGKQRASKPSPSGGRLRPVEQERRDLSVEVADLSPPRPREPAEIVPRVDGAAYRRIAAEDVDRESVGDVLVGGLLPGEAVAMER